jgi:hypothetical protein
VRERETEREREGERERERERGRERKRERRERAYDACLGVGAWRVVYAGVITTMKTLLNGLRLVDKAHFSI